MSDWEMLAWVPLWAQLLVRESLKLQDCWVIFAGVKVHRALCIKWLLLQLVLGDNFSPLRTQMPRSEWFYQRLVNWQMAEANTSWHLKSRQALWVLAVDGCGLIIKQQRAALNCITHINQRESETTVSGARGVLCCTASVCGDGNNNNSASPPVIH